MPAGEATAYCPVRHEWVAALPEEIVRQRLLKYMIDELQYPKGYLIVEKGLDQLPHMAGRNISVPERRADIVCVAPGLHEEHALYPLLIIECKALKLSEQAFKQVVGYNHYLGACFLAIANNQEIRTAWYDRNLCEYQFFDFLPSYSELLDFAVSSISS